MESFDFKGLDCNGGPLSGSIMEKIIHISKQLPQERYSFIIFTYNFRLLKDMY